MLKPKLDRLADKLEWKQHCGNPVKFTSIYLNYPMEKRLNLFSGPDYGNCSAHPNWTDEECYQAAKRNILKNYFLLGVQERMHDSLCLLHFELGLPWIPMEHARNSALAGKNGCPTLTSLFPQAALDNVLQALSISVASHKAAIDVLDEKLAKVRALLQESKLSSANDPSIGPECFGS